jgi:hypothetical protein
MSLPPARSELSSAIIAVCLLLSACAAPRNAATLADIASAHLNTLNVEMRAYVAAANDSRKNDSLRLASTRQYYQSIEDTASIEVRAWRANPEDPQSKNRISAFESLQQDATADMATTASSLRQQGNVILALESSYGQLTYSPTQLQAIVADLQSLSKRASDTTEVQVLASFSSSVLTDVKSGLNSSSLNPNGVSKQKLDSTKKTQ